MLLALFANGGKVGGATLKVAFNSLHGLRSRRYGFATRPEDFRSALREVAGAFIKPFGTHGVEVIDPSVLDLMNAVVLSAPENAVDHFAGATDFNQVEQLWKFATTPKGGTILNELRGRASELASTVASRMMVDRRHNLGKGGVAYVGVTFERRLSIVLDMANRLGATAITRLVAPLLERLLREWETERPVVNDTVDLLRELAGTQCIPEAEAARITTILKSALLEEVRTGCRSDELRELIGIIDASDADAEVSLQAAREAFEVYTESMFRDDIRECRSDGQFEGLIEDLELFRDELGVNITRLLSKIEEAQIEFEQNQSDRADYEQDASKERWRDERDNERSVSEMFGSLRGDRD